MCGRFKIDRQLEEIINNLDLILGDKDYNNFQPNHDARPTQILPIITYPNELQFAKWGLIPAWAKDDKMAYKTFNARCETLLEKSSYKKLVGSKRCLVPTRGFFEWKDIGKEKKQKYLFRGSEDYTLLAGLYDYNTTFNIRTFTIITCEPNKLMEDYHNRMPVILNSENRNKWLSNNITVEEAISLLQPYNSEISVEPVTI